jgi:hypothetical protein
MRLGEASECPVTDLFCDVDISVDLSLLYGDCISRRNSETHDVPVRGRFSISVSVDFSFLWS